MTRARADRLRTIAILAVCAGIPPSQAWDLPLDLVNEITDVIVEMNTPRR